MTLMIALPGLMMLSGPASAGQTWQQQYQRADSGAPCPAPADQTPWQSTFTGRDEWSASWAQWPNGETGGWVCERNIIWAQDSPPPHLGCVRWADTYGFYPGPLYYDFGYSPYLPTGSPTYTDASCSVSLGPSSTGTAYASTATAALAICQEYGVGLGYTTVLARLNSVWSCI